MARPQLQTEQFIVNLIAMVVGMLTAPVAAADATP